MLAAIERSPDSTAPRSFLAHIEVPLLTPRKRADFPPSPYDLDPPAKRVRTRARTERPSEELEEVDVVEVDSDGDEMVIDGRGDDIPVVEHHRDLNLYGQGLTKKELLEIRSTLGPLEEIEVGGNKHYLSLKHLHQYFYWLAERQRIYRRRAEGVPPMIEVEMPDKDPMLCWSLDPLFAIRASNVFRHQDVDSQFIIDNIIRDYRPTPEPDLEYRTSGLDKRYDAQGEWIDNLDEQVFRVTLYWRFTKLSTWNWLVKKLGDIQWRTYDYETYERALHQKKESRPNEPMFTGSYQIHPDKRYATGTNYGNAIASVEAFMKGYVPFFPAGERSLPPIAETLAATNRLENAFRCLSKYPGIGRYHALQLALSLNYCTFINLSTTEWIACGRGAKNGLNLIIPSIKGRDEDCNDGLLWLQQRQWDEWERLGYTPVGEEAKGAERVTIDGVDLVDIENSLCLYQKYARRLRKTELYHMARGDNPELDWIGSCPWDSHQGEGLPRKTLRVKEEERTGGYLRFWARVIQEYRNEIETGDFDRPHEREAPRRPRLDVIDVDEEEKPDIKPDAGDIPAVNQRDELEQDVAGREAAHGMVGFDEPVIEQEIGPEPDHDDVKPDVAPSANHEQSRNEPADELVRVRSEPDPAQLERAPVKREQMIPTESSRSGSLLTQSDTISAEVVKSEPVKSEPARRRDLTGGPVQTANTRARRSRSPSFEITFAFSGVARPATTSRAPPVKNEAIEIIDLDESDDDDVKPIARPTIKPDPLPSSTVQSRTKLEPIERPANLGAGVIVPIAKTEVVSAIAVVDQETGSVTSVTRIKPE